MSLNVLPAVQVTWPQCCAELVLFYCLYLLVIHVVWCLLHLSVFGLSFESLHIPHAPLLSFASSSWLYLSLPELFNLLYERLEIKKCYHQSNYMQVQVLYMPTLVFFFSIPLVSWQKWSGPLTSLGVGHRPRSDIGRNVIDIWFPYRYISKNYVDISICITIWLRNSLSTVTMPPQKEIWFSCHAEATGNQDGGRRVEAWVITVAYQHELR